MASSDKLTDPYGDLEYAVGSGDDFWCFAFYVDTKRKRVRLHAVINSETAHFIQDAEPPFWVPYKDAVSAAVRLVYEALDWCYSDPDHMVRHTIRGWNQDPMYFARSVEQAIKREQGTFRRVARKNGKTPEVTHGK